MNMIRNIIFILLFIASANLVAQPYEHSLGIRAGYSSGISYKGFLRHQMAAIEGDVLYNRHGFRLSLLYEYHLEPFQSKRWLAYFGGGAFGGNREGEFSTGLSVVTGIEYTVRDLPLNFSVDWRPMMNLYRLFDVDFLDFGVSIRYRFSL